MILWQNSSARGSLHHDAAARAGVLGMLALLSGWGVMVLAMMLPPALPLLRLVDRLVAERPRRMVIVGMATFGLLLPWLVVGEIFFASDLVVHAAVDRWAWAEAHSHWLAGVVLVLAGAYQFGPLKRRCLDACRSPFGFISRHWHGSSASSAEALVLGAAYGVSCIGCCWALMLVMFAAGLASLVMMMLLSGVMLYERLTPSVTTPTRVVGAALIAVGIARFTLD